MLCGFENRGCESGAVQWHNMAVDVFRLFVPIQLLLVKLFRIIFDFLSLSINYMTIIEHIVLIVDYYLSLIMSVD